MNRRRLLRAINLETLIMIVLMIVILLLLMFFMGASRKESAQAKRKSESVSIGQSVAEAAALTDDLDDLELELNLDDFKITGEKHENQTCEGLWRWEHKIVDQESNVQITYLETDYRIKVARFWENSTAKDHIEVYSDDNIKMLYSLDTETVMG